MQVDKEMFLAALDHPDALNVAGQLGRLDFVSLLIGWFGVLLALAAIFAFWEVRIRASSAAKKEANEVARSETKQIAPDIIRDYLKANPQLWATILRENPGILTSAMEGPINRALNNIGANAADNIAEQMEGGNGED